MLIFRVRQIIFTALGCLVWYPILIQAIQVKPMIFDMSTAGSNSHQTITVTNDQSKPIPVEVVINLLDIGPNGESIRTPGGEDDLLVFPPQTVIPPNSTQTFRVQWIGDNIRESRGYNISINEVPIRENINVTSKKQQGKQDLNLNIAFNFLLAAIIQPAMNSDSEVKQESQSFKIHKVELAKNDRGQPCVALTIENLGRIHNYLANSTLKLRARDWSRELVKDEIRNLAGPGLVLPKHTRRIIIPIDDLPKNPGNITANITF